MAVTYVQLSVALLLKHCAAKKNTTTNSTYLLLQLLYILNAASSYTSARHEKLSAPLRIASLTLPLGCAWTNRCPPSLYLHHCAAGSRAGRRVRGCEGGQDGLAVSVGHERWRKRWWECWWERQSRWVPAAGEPTPRHRIYSTGWEDLFTVCALNSANMHRCDALPPNRMAPARTR